MLKYLISKSATGKIRVVYLSASEEWDDELGGFTIERRHGQLMGKMQDAPIIVIKKGKAGRSHREQLELQFNSELKKYLDKGYKEIDKDPELCAESDLLEFLGDIKTDQSGFAKHMLAKPADKLKQETFDKLPYWYASRKIDGVRGGIYWDGKEIHIASRGGENYDCAMQQFRENEELIAFFETHPNFVLDGEIYKHGWSLQKLSGEARRCEHILGSDDLEFYIYDVMLPEIDFESRLKLLNIVEKSLKLGFEPNREWKSGELRMQMVPHEKVSGYDNIIKLHNDYVEEGWEGVVIRDPSKDYGFGKRTNAMIKVKKYRDSEFMITGISEGLREEDMCFTLVTEDGIEFKAKPWGTRELKQQYRRDLQQLIGKMATVKYFYLSDEGCPLQPSVKCIRDYE